MKYAIISDIHSNLEALVRALALIDERRVDEIVCLGDIVGYGANPNECVELVRKRCPTVLLGNHDAASLDTSRAHDFNRLAQRAVTWTSDMLTAENKKFLSSLPYTAHTDSVMFVHSSPHDPEAWEYIANDADARDAIDSFNEMICFIGHTHVPGIYSRTGRAAAVDREVRSIVNVGSVGQPRDGNPMLSFGIFDTTPWTFELVRSDYDIQTASEKILAAGLPKELGYRILYGM